MSSLVVLWCLTAIGELFIYRQNGVKESFICLQKDKCSWPDQWISMKPAFLSKNIPVFKTNITSSISEFQTRMVYYNRTHSDSGWIRVISADQHDFNYYYCLAIVMLLLLLLYILVKSTNRHTLIIEENKA